MLLSTRNLEICAKYERARWLNNCSPRRVVVIRVSNQKRDDLSRFDTVLFPFIRESSMILEAHFPYNLSVRRYLQTLDSFCLAYVF